VMRCPSVFMLSRISLSHSRQLVHAQLPGLQHIRGRRLTAKKLLFKPSFLETEEPGMVGLASSSGEPLYQLLTLRGGSE
jgi:hypothetical protein